MNGALSTERRTLGLGTAIAATVGVLWVSSTFWSHQHAKKELMELPPEERMSLYERTLATVRTTCAHSIGSELRDFCQAQASFLSGFPECNSECQRECENFRPRPTK